MGGGSGREVLCVTLQYNPITLHSEALMLNRCA